MKTLITLASVLNTICLVQALEKGERVWPHLEIVEGEDPYNKPRLEAIHKIVNGWPDDGSTFVSNSTVPDWQKPIEITSEFYQKELIENQNGEMNVPWLIAFVRTVRSQPQFYHSDFIMNSMKILSDDYQGKVRFGYVDVIKHELLKETFEIFAVPQNFFCVPEDGKVLCHEM
jgi:hypothetical protein